MTECACVSCGALAVAYVAKCPSCGRWNTLRAARVAREVAIASGTPAPASPLRGPLAVPSTSVLVRIAPRLPIGWSKVDAALGGMSPGFACGAVYLLSGEPGIGKSTIATQAAARVCRTHAGAATLYLTAEQSAEQARERIARVGASHDRLWLARTSDYDELCDTVRETAARLVVVDSVNAMARRGVNGRPGSPAQLLAVGAACVELAQELGIVVLLLARIVKDGSAAGPKDLEHVVDVVMTLDVDGRRVDDDGRRLPISNDTIRTLRVWKNRFGPQSSARFRMATNGELEDVSEKAAP